MTNLKASENKPPKNKGGRPKIKIDYDEVFKWAKLHCTQEEIASGLNLHLNTCRKDPEFMSVYKKGQELGKKSLRRLQWEKAVGRQAELLRDDDGNLVLNDKNRPVISRPGYAPDTTMQIFLGKNLLGQRDQVELTGDKENPFAVAVVIRDSCKGKPFKEVKKGKIKDE